MIGHGQPGLSTRRGTYLGLIDSSSGNKQAIVDLLMSKAMDAGAWTAEGLGVYSQAAALTYNNVIRAVVAVECNVSPYTLTRVDDVADVVAGTWFWDDDAAAPELFIELPDSSDPAGAVVTVHLLFTFGTKGVTHPWLGPNLFTDGELEDWTTSIDLTSYTEEVSGSGWDIAQAAGIYGDGSYAARLRAVDVTSGYQRFRQTVAGLVSGAWYRLSGAYSTTEEFSNLSAQMYAYNGSGVYLTSDGRSTAGVTALSLSTTQGETRRWVLDFIAFDTSLTFNFILAWVSGTGNGSLTFDDLKLQRNYRFHYYEPRLASNAIPELNMAMSRLGFGGKTVGVGSLRIINQDGAFEPAFGDLVPVTATVAGGGEFQDGQSITREDCHVSYPGLVQDVDGSDESFDLRLEVMTFLQRVLPSKDYTLAEFPNMELSRVGYGRPLAFGRGNFGGPALRYVPLTRLGVDATTQYGDTYELVDTSDAPNGVGAFTVHSFLTTELRDQAQ